MPRKSHSPLKHRLLHHSITCPQPNCRIWTPPQKQETDSLVWPYWVRLQSYIRHLGWGRMKR